VKEERGLSGAPWLSVRGYMSVPFSDDVEMSMRIIGRTVCRRGLARRSVGSKGDIAVSDPALVRRKNPVPLNFRD